MKDDVRSILITSLDKLAIVFMINCKKNKKKNLIPIATIRYLQTMMTDDFRRLYKLFVL